MLTVTARALAVSGTAPRLTLVDGDGTLLALVRGPGMPLRLGEPTVRAPALEGDQGVTAEKVNKVLEGRPHIVDAITNGDVQLVFNTTEGPQALADSRSLRRAALLHKVPYYTTLSGAVAAAKGIRAYLGGDLEVRTLQSYFSES